MRNLKRLQTRRSSDQTRANLLAEEMQSMLRPDSCLFGTHKRRCRPRRRALCSASTRQRLCASLARICRMAEKPAKQTKSFMFKKKREHFLFLTVSSKEMTRGVLSAFKKAT